MIEISPAKVAHVIVKSREFDVKVASWDDSDGTDESDSILEDTPGDATRSEAAQFIAGLNDDEQASLVALTWIGRGTFSAEEYDEAVETAKSEKVNKTEDYLLGIPLLSDYLEEGLDKMGISVETAEQDIL